MPKLQIVALQPRAGIAKTTQRPYNMLIVKGVVTTDEGVVDTCELMFMESQNRKLPVLAVGQTYEPQVALYVNREGRLAASVESLKPITVRAA